MVDHLSRSRRSANMARISAKDTKPELTVRRMLHAAGYRYRVHGAKLPGRPDLVFARRRKVVFVHGCFWHQHQSQQCGQGRRPKTNTSYWHAKLDRNVLRDRENVRRLEAQGWQYVIVWACELKDLDRVLKMLETFLGPRRIGRTCC